MKARDYGKVEPRPIELTAATKFLSLDVESNGLHGPAFAVGAVLVNGAGEVFDEFAGRCPIRGEVDEWVAQNVLPPMEGMPVNYRSAKAMRTGFWDWFQAAKARADWVIADNGYPVEARFLIACQDDDLEHRYWEHPFPLLDLSSMLVLAGYKPLMDRNGYVADEIRGQNVRRHNPRWDAWASALAMIKILKTGGHIK